MKETNRQELEELMSMFHDFEIVGIKFEQPTLSIDFRIPWGFLWKDYDYQIKVNFIGCDFLKCDYSILRNKELVKTEETFNWVYESEDLFTTKVEVIKSLELDVQSFKYSPPKEYKLLCNGNKCAGAELSFNCDTYKIFDKGGDQIDLNKMKEWATDWWDNIEKMCEENKKKK